MGNYPAALSCHCASVLCGWVCLSLHRECHNSTESWAETWYLKRASKLEQYMRHASEHLLLCTLDGNKLFYLDLLDSLPIYLFLIFFKSLFHEIDFWTWFLDLNFLSILNLIFAGYTGSKNQVWNRQKNQVQNSISWNTDFKNQVYR